MKKGSGWKLFLLLIILLIVILLSPYVVYLCTSINPQVIDGSATTPWIGFWGSYLGGLLGSIAALIALFETRHQSRAQQYENNENRRLSVLPALNISCRPIGVKETVKSFFVFKPDDPYKSFFEQTKAEHSSDTSKQEVILCFTNIGLGPAFNINVSYNNNSVKIDGLKAGQTNEYAIKFMLSSTEDKSFQFSVSFSDILGNTYNQEQIMKISKGELFFSAVSAPNKVEQNA